MNRKGRQLGECFESGGPWMGRKPEDGIASGLYNRRVTHTPIIVLSTYPSVKKRVVSQNLKIVFGTTRRISKESK
jgi:hypothetical protein